jgi:hypothetical protein
LIHRTRDLSARPFTSSARNDLQPNALLTRSTGEGLG